MIRRVVLLFAILTFGSVVETAWHVKQGTGGRIDLGPGGCVVNGSRFVGPSFSFETTAPLTVASGSTVEVENAFGAVRVAAGAPGEGRAVLRKVVYLASEGEARAFAERIQLQASPEGASLVVRTNRRALESEGKDVSFETHLDLTLPPGTVVRVRNEHGRVEVRDVAGAEVASSFESVDVQRVTGPVQIDSRHADVSVAEARGPLTLTSAHGDVEVRDVQEAVTADVAHGETSVVRVGALTLKQQHGDVKAEDVKGDLRIRAEHAAVSASNLGGVAEVETSYENVKLERVASNVRVVVRHGGLEAEDVKGSLTAEAAYDDVSIARVDGPVDVSVSSGSVTARTIGKGARVRASGDGVVIQDFRGPIDVQSDRGDVRLLPGAPITDAVTVSARHGGVHLEVPAGSRFALEASTRAGDLSVHIPSLQGISRADANHLSGVVGGGGASVRLEADGGGVEVTEPGTHTADDASDKPDDDGGGEDDDSER